MLKLFVSFCAVLTVVFPSAACGPFLPEAWLDDGGRPLGRTPEFFWALETRRIAKDFPVPERATSGGERDPMTTEEATAATDESDFRQALEAGLLAPLDPAEALARHLKARQALDALVKAKRAAPEHRMFSWQSEIDRLISLATFAKFQIAAGIAVNAEFPSEFSEYHRGALAYHCNQKTVALTVWRSLLERPAAERRYRSVWAAYMMGKAQRIFAPDQAMEAFRRARELAVQGCQDTTGLAEASYGDEARIALDAGRVSGAVELYLKQLAAGGESAVASLKIIMRGLRWSGEAVSGAEFHLESAAVDPLLRRLVTAFLLCGAGPNDVFRRDEPGKDRLAAWLKAVERARGDMEMPDAEYLGWVAYSGADFDGAARWLKLANPERPAAAWLAAKLCQRAGNWREAALALRKAAPALLAEERATGFVNLLEGASAPGRAAHGDWGVVQLTRGRFTEALDVFWKGGLPDDAWYVAERVLTVKELKHWVDRECPEPPEIGTLRVVERDNEEYGRRASEIQNAALMRRTLGARLVREGNIKEARAYFSKPDRQALDAYAAALSRTGRRDLSKKQRAHAWFIAACVVRHHGMEILGTTGAPDNARYDGAFPSVDWPGRQRLTGRITRPSWVAGGEEERFVPLPYPVTREERKRLRRHAVQPERRFHYRTVAARLALKAAALLPENCDELADVLNTAGNWVKYSDHPTAMRIHQALESRCWKTDIGRASIAIHWFVTNGSGPWSDELGGPLNQDE